MQNMSMENVGANNNTGPRTVSTIHMGLGHITVLSNLGMKVKSIKVRKYDKFSIITAYKDSAALRLAIYVKRGGRYNFPE